MSNETPAPSSPLTATTPAAPTYADPAALGLAGFALTTLVLSFVNANIIKETGAIIIVLGLAAFYGGLAQFIAGVLEWRRGNTFGLMAFCSYGAFWLSYWWLVTHLPLRADVHQAVGLYLIGWCIITAYLTLASLRTNLAVTTVLVLLTITFLFLAIGAFQNGLPGPDTMTKVGGWLGIFTAAAAFYASAGVVVNATHKRDLLPLPTLPGR